MKKNTTILVLLSLVIGAIVTVGLTRYKYETASSWENDNSSACYTTLQDKTTACTEFSLGYPFRFVHGSTVLVKGDTGTWAPETLTYSWVQFKTAIVDWVIWSAATAAGLGILILALEKSGSLNGFKAKKKSRR